tara:strand:- start:3579 stop:4562 length:984 start_codon:yes stop_codon:yes gene_type:complete
MQDKKKIWIDVANAPHVKFAEFLASEFGEGKVFITSRDHSNNIKLLKKSGLNYSISGKHWGKSSISKIFGLLHRAFTLFMLLKDKDIKVGFSQSSFYSPLVCKLLGIKCIYTNDNEYALGNIIADIFSDVVIYPNSKKFPKYKFLLMGKCEKYEGIKEAIYCKKIELVSLEKKEWYFRPQMTDALYHDEVNNDILLQKYIKFAKELGKKIICLPRNNNQKNNYLKLQCNNFSVSDRPLTLHEIAPSCELFLGAGGTMTRELACLNIPTISFFQEKKLYVDKLLQKAGLLIYDDDLKDIKAFINNKKKFVEVESDLDLKILKNLKHYL